MPFPLRRTERRITSGFPLETDIVWRGRHVRKLPRAAFERIILQERAEAEQDAASCETVR